MLHAADSVVPGSDEAMVSFRMYALYGISGFSSVLVVTELCPVPGR